MEVTRKALIVLLAGITVGPFPAYSIEPESEFQRGYVERMSDWICEDPDYIQCLGI